MPPLAGQRRLNAPPVDGPASVPQPPQHTNPPRSFPAPARPCQTEAKFPRGAGGGCCGKALHGGSLGAPTSLRYSPRLQQQVPASFPARRLPAISGSGSVQPAGSRSPAPPSPAPQTAPASWGPFPVPRHLVGAGRTRTPSKASYRGSAEGCGRLAGADAGSRGTLARERAPVADKETLWTSTRRWARDSRAPAPSLLLLICRSLNWRRRRPGLGRDFQSLGLGSRGSPSRPEENS